MIMPLLCLIPLAGWAQEPIDTSPLRPDDQIRLSHYHAAAGEALLEAFAGGETADLAILTDAPSGEPLPPNLAMDGMSGEWNCRMIKIGGLLPITAYSPFRCVIGADGSFEKFTGSQRTKGQIHQDGDRLIYLGTGFIAGDTPPDYADLPVEIDAQASPQRMPEVGVVEMFSADRGRILFPEPHLESRFNILSLSR